jgi:hypothetical protein
MSPEKQYPSHIHSSGDLSPDQTAVRQQRPVSAHFPEAT